jgi:hypothetical protein
MKKSELKEIIREEIKTILKDGGLLNEGKDIMHDVNLDWAKFISAWKGRGIDVKDAQGVANWFYNFGKIFKVWKTLANDENLDSKALATKVKSLGTKLNGVGKILNTRYGKGTVKVVKEARTIKDLGDEILGSYDRAKFDEKYFKLKRDMEDALENLDSHATWAVEIGNQMLSADGKETNQNKTMKKLAGEIKKLVSGIRAAADKAYDDLINVDIHRKGIASKLRGRSI